MVAWLLAMHAAALTCETLIAYRQGAWTEATRHQFSGELMAGALDPSVYATWLVQNQFLLKAEVRLIGTILTSTYDSSTSFEPLSAALSARVDEIRWNSDLQVSTNVSSAFHTLRLDCAQYIHYIEYDLRSEAHCVRLVALWAMDRTYSDAFCDQLKGGFAPTAVWRYHMHPTQAFHMERLCSDERRASISLLEDLVNDQLKEGQACGPGGAYHQQALVAFENVLRMEAGFWSMAYSEGSGAPPVEDEAEAADKAPEAAAVEAEEVAEAKEADEAVAEAVKVAAAAEARAKARAEFAAEADEAAAMHTWMAEEAAEADAHALAAEANAEEEEAKALAAQEKAKAKRRKKKRA